MCDNNSASTSKKKNVYSNLPRRIDVKTERPSLDEDLKKLTAEKLQTIFGHKSFLSTQQKVAIIYTLHRKNDLFIFFPTGSGKSLIYQLPGMHLNVISNKLHLAVVLEGVTVVFSPLIALIADQVNYLQSKGVRAEALNSSISSEKFNEIIEVIDLATFLFAF
jgi:ATP-dependent DNA helicase RecQ